ncbi:MAG: hypothetical protein GX811_03170 [Lentisphaerae bacterium]|nr:hypothetical protein [Lentisphaerota bacterium]
MFKSNLLKGSLHSVFIVIVAILVLFAVDLNLFIRSATITALTFILVLNHFLATLDLFKNYKPGFREIGAFIEARSDLKIGAWNFDETTRAGLYFYSNIVLPEIEDQTRLNRLLSGSDKSFDAVLSFEKQYFETDRTGTGIIELKRVVLGSNRLLKIESATDPKAR